MSYLAPKYNKEDNILQPNFVRSRAWYRSPRSSVTTNLEAEQLRYDIHNLRHELDSIWQSIEATLEMSVEGGDIYEPSLLLEAVLFFNAGSGPEFDSPVFYDGETFFNVNTLPLDDLIAKMENLKLRISRLEHKEEL